MEIYLPQAISLNATSKNKFVVAKYIAMLTAEQISTYMSYEWKKELRANPLVISANSLIRLDKDNQRGHADEYQKNLLQQKSKVDDIANTILGKLSGSRAFLGTLVWNIRPDDGTIKLLETVEEGVRERGIKINTKAIYLPDSAHRHFGIAEAYRRFTKNPENFPNFDPNTSFSIEIYALDSNGEAELFRELNAKQKMISSAKKLAVDTVTPAGRLKGRILQLDEGQVTTHYDPELLIGTGPFFHDNYDETSTSLSNHKLLTMSVFMAAINEMFSKDELEKARSDEGLAEKLAQYFIRFFYTLRETIQVVVDFNDGPKILTPFYNLYEERIRVIAEGSAKYELLKTAVEDAIAYAKHIRQVDKTNSNPVIKAFARLGKTIRYMPRWDHVLDRIQTHGFEKIKGRLFQSANTELVNRSIASIKKTDGLVNIQVNDKEVTAIYEYLCNLAGLEENADSLYVILNNERTSAKGYVVSLERDKTTTLQLELNFWVALNVEFEQQELNIRIENDRNWTGGTFTTAKKYPKCSKLELLDVEHPIYEKNLRKYLAQFEVIFPPYELAAPEKFNLALTVHKPSLDGSVEKMKIEMLCQPRGKR